MPTYRVSVAGASGYAGGELLRLVLGHPHLELAALAAGSQAGEPVAAVHPHLPALHDRCFDATDPALLADADLVLLALPHGQSAALVAQLPTDLPVVDLGADHRLADPADWERHYAGPAALPFPGPWPYGLPELLGPDLVGARRVAAPGCYATAVSLAYGPLLAADLVAPDDLVAVAASGTSGAGRAAAVGLLGSEVMGDVRAYKVASHQHVPEIRQTLRRLAGSPVGLSLTTLLAPMPRGILATCTGRTDADAATLRAALREAYATSPLVHVLPEGVWPRTASTVGSAACHLQVDVDADAGRAVVVSALDNLGKGAAAQALQCANLVLGLPESTGLPVQGVAP